jgi:hypothetical protein
MLLRRTKEARAHDLSTACHFRLMPLDITTIVLDSVKALTGVGALVVAALGLQTWRRQLYGTAEYERARRLYRAVLEVRDQLTAVRSPFISIGEMTAAFKEIGAEPEGGDVSRDKRADQLVYDRRWKGVVKAMTDLRVELLEAEVLWGDSVRAPETQLRQCVGSLYAAVLSHVQNRHDTNRESRGSAELRQKHFDLLYDQSAAELDGFAKQLNGIVASFENLLRPHLNPRLSRSRSARALPEGRR